MCDIRLFKSAYMDYQAAVMLYKKPFHDEMFLNIAAYHLQQCTEKVIKGALECVGVTVPNTHRIAKLLQMVSNNGANLIVTDWIDDHAEMLSEWEAESRYNMDFVVERRKLDRAISEIGIFEKCRKELEIVAGIFLNENGIDEKLRKELSELEMLMKLKSFLPEHLRECSDFELNCYYIMFAKRLTK